MEISNLIELMEVLSCGTKLHIGVLFFGRYGNKKMSLPREHQIHSSPLCELFKSTRKGYNRCFRCRNAAIRKVLEQKTSFGGCCLNGVYEYMHPIIENEKVVAMIYIGNILPESKGLLSLRLKEYGIDPSLINTLEQNISMPDCKCIANVIESYIRMLALFFSDREEKNPLIENLIKYALANLEYPLDLDCFSEVFHYNPKYLGRIFKAEMGMSLCEFVNKERCERAKIFLSQGWESVIDIAYKIGFENVTYFNRVFKKYTGVTPTEYRKGITEKKESNPK